MIEKNTPGNRHGYRLRNYRKISQMPFVRSRRTLIHAVLRELRCPDVDTDLPPLQCTHHRHSGVLQELREILNPLEKVPEMQHTDLGKSGVL